MERFLEKIVWCTGLIFLLIAISYALLSGTVGGGIFSAVFVLAMFAGLGWLVFRCCRFSIAQALAASFLYGAAMLIRKTFYAGDNFFRLLVIAICNALAVATGLFVGVRNAQAAAKRGTAWQWFVFLCGLLFVYAVPGALFIALLDIHGVKPTSFFLRLLGIPIMLISWACLATTFLNLKGEKIKPQTAPDEKQDKGCAP